MTIDTDEDLRRARCHDDAAARSTITLDAKDAPKTVNSFVFLAKQHFYDGLTFHRSSRTS